MKVTSSRCVRGQKSGIFWRTSAMRCVRQMPDIPRINAPRQSSRMTDGRLKHPICERCGPQAADFRAAFLNRWTYKYIRVY